jgi:hypothetical protein
MNKLLNELSERRGFTVRNLQGWGEMNGYWFGVSMPPNVSQPVRVFTAVRLPDEASSSLVDMALSKMMREHPNVSAERKGGAVTVRRKMPFPYNKLKAQDVEELLARLVMAFRQAGAEPACFRCGEQAAEGFAMVDGTALKLCSACQGALEASNIQQAEEYKAVENYYLRGIFGAIAGALLGSVAWILIGLLGRIAIIGGMAISFCAFKGYALLKGKINKPAILIICLVSIVGMLFAQFISMDITFYKAMTDAGYSVDFGEILQHTFEIPFMDSEIQSAFMRDTLLGLLFLAIGAYWVVKPLFAKAKAPVGTFERL